MLPPPFHISQMRRKDIHTLTDDEFALLLQCYSPIPGVSSAALIQFANRIKQPRLVLQDLAARGERS